MKKDVEIKRKISYENVSQQPCNKSGYICKLKTIFNEITLVSCQTTFRKQFGNHMSNRRNLSRKTYVQLQENHTESWYPV